MESVTENIPPLIFGFEVRVKWRGKSSPLQLQGRRQDKPHMVQDKTEEMVRPDRKFASANG